MFTYRLESFQLSGVRNADDCLHGNRSLLCAMPLYSDNSDSSRERLDVLSR